MRFVDCQAGVSTRFRCLPPCVALLALMAWPLPAVARDPAVGEEPDAGAESKDMAADTTDAKQFNRRYAEVYLKIAELNLQKARNPNRRVSNTIPASEIDRLKEIVHLAETQHQAASSGDNQSVTLENDRSQIKVTEDSLQKAVAANNRAPGSVPQIELDRLRLLSQLSRLQLAKDQAAQESKSTAAKLKQRVDQLEEQVRELQTQVADLLAASRAKSADEPHRPAATAKK